jgi:hypothetical protein
MLTVRSGGPGSIPSARWSSGPSWARGPAPVSAASAPPATAATPAAASTPSRAPTSPTDPSVVPTNRRARGSRRGRSCRRTACRRSGRGASGPGWAFRAAPTVASGANRAPVCDPFTFFLQVRQAPCVVLGVGKRSGRCLKLRGKKVTFEETELNSRSDIFQAELKELLVSSELSRHCLLSGT